MDEHLNVANQQHTMLLLKHQTSQSKKNEALERELITSRTEIEELKEKLENQKKIMENLNSKLQTQEKMMENLIIEKDKRINEKLKQIETRNNEFHDKVKDINVIQTKTRNLELYTNQLSKKLESISEQQRFYDQGMAMPLDRLKQALKRYMGNFMDT